MNTASNILNDMQEAREQIIALCGFTEEELNQLQWDAALDCLRKVLRSDEYGLYELPKQADFWLWWKEQWYRRDVAFLANLTLDVNTLKYCCLLPGANMKLYLHNEGQLRGAYRSFHRISHDNPLLNNERMEVSFHRMIKDISNRNHLTT